MVHPSSGIVCILDRGKVGRVQRVSRPGRYMGMERQEWGGAEVDRRQAADNTEIWFHANEEALALGWVEIRAGSD